MLLGFALLNSCWKLSLWRRLCSWNWKENCEDNMKLKRLWGLHEDEESTWGLLVFFFWVLRHRVFFFLPIIWSMKKSKSNTSERSSEDIRFIKRKKKPMIGAPSRGQLNITRGPKAEIFFGSPNQSVLKILCFFDFSTQA